MCTWNIESAEIAVRDVGFGDSIYVKVRRAAGEDVSYLIDTGYLRNARIYEAKLDEVGIKKIDTLILTHKHSDHISAATHIIDNYKKYGLKNIFVSFHDIFFASKSNAKLSHKLRKIYDEHNLPINIFDINGDAKARQILDFHVLHPGDEYPPDSHDMNRNSIVLLLCVGQYGVLFTGDATSKEEPLILYGLRMHEMERVQALKIPHHGSSTSTSINFLNELPDLKYAIVSASAQRSKNLPSKEFEGRWRDFSKIHNCQMFYTEDGEMRQDVRLSIDSKRGCTIACGGQEKYF